MSNKGVPVCFFVTNREVTNVIAEWLEWVKETITTRPKRIMIDCSAAEISAIRQVFSGVARILLCHWHIKRAWEKHIKTDVKVPNATHESVIARSNVRLAISKLMKAESPEAFDTYWSEFKSLEVEYSIFVAYFEKMWLERKGLWSKAWRLDATFHTNNMIESYHNQLKSFYLTRSRNKRVDRVVYTLVHLILCDYRSEHLQVELGLKDMPLNDARAKRRRVANLLDINVAQSMVNFSLVNDEMLFTCLSFTKDKTENVFYTVSLHPSGKFTEKCSCPDSSILCKHIFLVSRTHVIPYHDTSSITCRVADEFSDDISNPVIEEGSDDLQAVLRQQQQLRLDTLSESLEQAYAVIGAQIKDLNK